MNKKIIYILLLWVVVSSSACAETWGASAEYPLVDHTVQVGVDAWRFNPKAPDSELGMANDTVWKYRPESPWVKVEGNVVASKNLRFTMKARADQGMGMHVDEMSADWAYSPSFGFKAGVVSYKTSWCRIYDVDSPWVRENDPFCTSYFTSEASGGAPGGQMYLNSLLGSYRAQAMVGTYRPLLFNFNTTEFSNTRYANSRIDVNDKNGASLSLLHMPTATEVRMGLLSAKQSARVRFDNDVGIYTVGQTYEIVFAGVSFYATPQLNVRLQTLRHNMSSALWAPSDSVLPHFANGLNLVRRSNVAELNYQHRTQDVFALAVSQYSFDSVFTYTNYPDLGYTRKAQFPYLLRSLSASWRHDWEGGFYTSLQWTYSRARAEAFQEPNSSGFAYRDAHGLGLRLAYRF
jgi:hypothetical protein